MGEKAGFGGRPAVIVVDMTVAFTDPESPLGCDLDEAVEGIAEVLRAARSADVPALYTTVSYGPREQVAARAVLRKMPAALICQPGTKWVEVDERLRPADGEFVYEKVFPSAFFGTTVGSHLIALGCDSVVVTGASTSGCVRATVVDAASHGFRVIVPAEAVGDRLPEAHARSLADIEMKYGDVVSVAETVAWLTGGAAGHAALGDSAWPVGGR